MIADKISDKLVDRQKIRALWRSHGGGWHGPHVEHYSIPEDAGFWPFMQAALSAAYAKGMEDAREIASGQFGWDVDVWRDMTKKDMTRLMAEAIVAAIDARLSAIKGDSA